MQNPATTHPDVRGALARLAEHQAGPSAERFRRGILTARVRVPRELDLRASHVQGEVDAVSSGWGTCGPEGGEGAGG